MIEELVKPQTPAALYKQTLEWLDSAGYHAQLNPSSSSTCYHDVMIVTEPEKLPGITYPAGFKIKRLLALHEIELLQDAFIGADDLSEELRTFMAPLIFPQANSKANTDIINHVQQVITMSGNLARQYGDNIQHLGISFYPSTTNGQAPVAYIPEASWFSEHIRQLRLEDVFTIFPPAEIEMIRLFIGRAVVGRTNHIPVGWDKPIKHTSRIMLAIVGKTAGTGKSTLWLNWLDALRKVGYTSSFFGDLSGRFNMGEVANSMISMCDDVTSKQMRGVLTSPIIKSLVTNAPIRVENKGENAYTAESHCTLLFNTNHLDANILQYELDPGIIDRCKFVSTYSGAEMRSLTSEQIGGVSQGSPSVYPVDHLQWLARKLECSVDTIMLWVSRLCADHFWNLIKDEPSQLLWSETIEISKRLRLTIDRTCLESFIQLLIMSEAVDLPAGTQLKVPELSVKLLSHALERARFLAIDPSAYNFRTQLKEMWIKAGRPEVHPWFSIRRLSIISIDASWHALQEAKALSMRDLDNAIKLTFGSLRTRTGTHISHSPVAVIEAWNEARTSQAELQQLMNELTPHLSLPLKPSSIQADYLYQASYNPEAL